ncbi:MAG: hypothetical protein AAF490_03635 [Chloroflexota bacterium]
MHKKWSINSNRMAEGKEALEKQVQRAIFQESIFRTESALAIAFFIIMTVLSALGFLPSFLDFFPAWGWLGLGAIVEAALVYSSITDPDFGAEVAAKLLQTNFEPGRIRDKKINEGIRQALDYRSRIEKAIRERSDSMLKDELSQTASQIDDWLENMYDLANRIDRYQRDQKILERDRQRNNSRIRQLRQQLQSERNEAVKSQVASTLESMERQQETIRSLDDTIKRARLQFENSLVHLGTIYSQTVLFDAKDIDSGRARRLRQEIADEVIELNDVLTAMDEVYAEG